MQLWLNRRNVYTDLTGTILRSTSTIFTHFMIEVSDPTYFTTKVHDLLGDFLEIELVIDFQ